MAAKSSDVVKGGAVPITRYRPGRIVAVTVGLCAAGTAFGAVAGAVTLGTVLLLSRDFDHLADPRLYGIAATIGAILGTLCAPLAGWLLLRRVPLGRAFAGLTLGTVLGGVVGWFVPMLHQGDRLLIAPVLGFLGAAVILRIWHTRRSHNRASTDDGPAKV